MRNDVGLTVHDHAEVRSGVVPYSPLHHIGHTLVPVCLAAGADSILLWNGLLLEEIKLICTGLVSGVAVLLVLQDSFAQGEGQGLDGPAQL